MAKASQSHEEPKREAPVSSSAGGPVPPESPPANHAPVKPPERDQAPVAAGGKLGDPPDAGTLLKQHRGRDLGHGVVSVRSGVKP